MAKTRPLIDRFIDILKDDPRRFTVDDVSAGVTDQKMSVWDMVCFFEEDLTVAIEMLEKLSGIRVDEKRIVMDWVVVRTA